jgi:hypothetical protein
MRQHAQFDQAHEMSRPLCKRDAPLGQIEGLVASAGDTLLRCPRDVVHDRLDHMRLSEEVGFDLLEVTPLHPPLTRLR